LPARFPTINIGHTHIQHDQVGPVVVELMKPFAAIIGGKDLRPSSVKTKFDHLAKTIIIVNYQNFLTVHNPHFVATKG